MSLEPGQRLAHYIVAGKIGEGGMGVVYRATDTRLNREVAIKVLPPALAGDADRLARFQREAHVLASLNHPGIASIYGLEEAGGVRALVLELVEGPTLAERLAASPLPLNEALEIALPMAEALEAAHERGIIHRDLKPANVKITPGGAVKLLDFGLAKALEEEGDAGSQDASRSPTLTAAATRAGVILGTAAYMSPEQARGKPADRRADIWAFGVVLYEMLSGQRLFEGETISDVLAAVLTRKPDLDTLPAGTPPAIRRLLDRCLQPDPRRRLQAMGDARVEIDDALAGRSHETPAPSAVAPAAGRTALAPWLGWALALAAGAAAGWLALRPASEVAPPVPTVSASLTAPEGAAFELGHGLALSPAGDRLAFPARGADGLRRLWVRPLDRAGARPLPGTEGARFPFWSPDGRSLGYFADGKLRRIEVDTGLQESLADAPWAFGGAWGPAGDILFQDAGGDGLLRVPASGGVPSQVTMPATPGDAHLWPSFLPDGRHFLFLVRIYGRESATAEIQVGSLDGAPPRTLVESNSNALYAPPGYLIWWRGGNLRAQRLDLDTFSLVGEPALLASDAAFDARIGHAAFSLAGGVLVYQLGGATPGNELAWLDAEGNDLGTVGPRGSLYSPRLSPDGLRIAVDISDETNRGDIWTLDAVRGSATRLTSIPEDESAPVWSPDGKELLHFSNKGGQLSAIYRRPARTGPASDLLLGDPEAKLRPLDWTSAGLLLVAREQGGQSDILVYDLEEKAWTPLASSSFNEIDARFSPDGGMVAYTSDETGREEVYVQTFPGGAVRLPVSPAGGKWPVWGPRGDTIFFRAPDNSLMAVQLQGGTRDEGSGLRVGTPRPLFRADIKEHSTSAQYDTVDGQRFLVNREVGAATTEPLALILNWAAALAAAGGP